MVPYLTAALSIVVFALVLALPWSNTVEGNHYQHTEIYLQDDHSVFRSDGITRIKNNNVVHLASLQDSTMTKPIVVRFAGTAKSFNQFGFSLSGSLNLLSIQNLRPIIDDAIISPYLLLNDDPYSLDIDILYTAEDYVIIRERHNGRVKLLANR
ncbi:hypothetical protein F0225_07185 [Vibrio pectenicida]|uniref:Uncharacterized protein n=1 Tax=Vibrio pectenicida TaxID=62763 RepID=A0A3R9EEJ3_9VIBR|nr:hypothetical protein [Vibrio pectenicida]NOH71125.1 hypothetical protein [Vibrio pectenicida]RSD29933.1 hypothetical protein EJA03_16520 [Vibrio pectenicida]